VQFAAEIRAARAVLGWSQTEFASEPLSLYELSTPAPTEWERKGFCHPRSGQEGQLLSESGEVPACYRFSSLPIFIIKRGPERKRVSARWGIMLVPWVSGGYEV
jgi:hypothetical protein